MTIFLRALIVTLLLSATAIAENWSQWRGPNTDGRSAAADIPVKWGSANVEWKTRIPGQGHSSPVAWQDRIFLTSGTDNGRSRTVHCLQATGAEAGKILWSKVVWKGAAERVHRMNSRATATCATDGKRVYASFGSGGLYCLSVVDGNTAWKKELGQFDTRGWGTASSPVIVGKAVVQCCDGDNQAYLVAYDRATGKQLWRTPRPKNRSWSSPTLANVDGNQILLLNGHAGMSAYNAKTGKRIWYNLGGSGRGTPSVVAGGGLAVAISGRSRGDGDMIAVRLSAKGKVSRPNEAWRIRRGGRDLPSPIIVGKYLLACNLRPGVATCYDLASGRLLWKKRLPAGFSASPISVKGLVYFLDQSGQVSVVKPGPKFDLVASNRIDPASSNEVFRAGMMPQDSRIYLRSNTTLYCVGK